MTLHAFQNLKGQTLMKLKGTIKGFGKKQYYMQVSQPVHSSLRYIPKI